MAKIVRSLILALLSVALLETGVFAEDGEKALERYDQYYNKDKFNSLAGEDGILTKEDWISNRTKKEAQEFGNFRWERAIKFDADGDGALDIHEAAAYKQAEKQALINHSSELPYLYKNQDWLKSHPAIAKKLVANNDWLEAHPDVAKKIYSNRTWLNNHPEVAKEAYANRKFLDNHPQFSQDAYKYRKYLNEHSQGAKKAYRKAQKHTRAAKKAYSSGRSHPYWSQKAARHPRQARKIYRRRRH